MTPIVPPAASIKSCPSVCVITAHGRQTLNAGPDERLVDILGRNGVPWAAVSTYVAPSGGGQPFPFPCLGSKLKEIPGGGQVLVYFNRNVNPFAFSLNSFKTIEDSDATDQVTDFFYQRFDNSASAVELYLKRLTSDECKGIVAARVAETVRSVVPRGTDLVVGVSGGGDSNALLHALVGIRDHGLTLHPIIITGLPEWDEGVSRSRQLCMSYGLELTVLEEKDTKGLLGLKQDSEKLIDCFEREFQGDDFEFLGTLLIRLALSSRAQQIGTSFICTGLNLEDVVCENLYRLSNGLRPASTPYRNIGDTTLVFPLWMCPKRVIDGCFPKYSLDNYMMRYPSVALGRNLYYSVVYSLESQFPGFIEQVARGLSELAQNDPVVYSSDDQLGFHVERPVPLPLRWKFQKMLGRTVDPAAPKSHT